MKDTQAPGSQSTSPYVGLRNFTEDTSDFFFGREADGSRIIGNLRVARLTLLYAESGVGKSSLLRAGVASRLRAARTAVTDRNTEADLPVVFSSWSADPIPALIESIGAAVRDATGEAPSLANHSLAQAIEAATTHANCELLIILDQFEEYFTNWTRERDGDEFPQHLASCINDPNLRVNFLISIREDAYARVGELLRGLVGNVYGNYLHLDYLSESAAREAITKPLERWNELHDPDDAVSIDPQLVDAVLGQVRLGAVHAGEAATVTTAAPARDDGATRIETTYLQLVMKRIWDEERLGGSQQLRLETLRRLGGAQQIISTHLDEAMSELNAAQRDVAASVFRFLVTTSGMKVALSTADLADMAGCSEVDVEAVLRRLSAADLHILRPVAAPDDRSAFEIFHDALAQPIRDWRRRYLSQQAAETQHEELERQRIELARVNAQVRRERRRRVLLSGISLLLAVLLVLAFVLWQRSEDLSRTRDSAKLASQSLAEQSDPRRALVLAKQAVDRAETPESLHALRAALGKPYIAQVMPLKLPNIAYSTSVQSSPDARYVAMGQEARVWIWDKARHRALKLPAVRDVQDMAFSGDSKRLVVVGDHETWMFDARTGQRLGDYKAPEQDGYDWGAATDAEGARIISLPGNGTEITVRSPDGTHLGAPLEGNSKFLQAEYAKNGLLVTLTEDHTLAVWDADGTKRSSIPNVTTFELSPDGSLLLTGGAESVVRVWQLDGLTAVAAIATEGPVQQFVLDNRERETIGAVDAKGSLSILSLADLAAPPRNLDTGRSLDAYMATVPGSPIVLTSGSGSVSLWDAHLGAEVERFDLPGQIYDLHLARDGTYSFLQFTHDKFFLWNGRTASSLAQLGPGVVQTAFSGDAKHLQVVYEDANGFTAEVRSYPELAPGSAVRPGGPFETFGAVDNLFVNSDRQGRRLATVSQHYSSPYKTRIQVWDLASGMVRDLESRFANGLIDSVSVTSDDSALLISGYDGTQSNEKDRGFVEQIPLDGRDRSQRRISCLCEITALATAPNGKFMVVGDDRGRIYISREGSKLRRLSGGGRTGVTNIAVSPDSRYIAAGDGEGHISLWDRTTRVGTFDLKSKVTALTFATGDRYLVADGESVSSTVLSTDVLVRGDDDEGNAVMLVDPVPEPPAQTAGVAPSRSGTLDIVSVDGEYALNYPCVACASDDALMAEAQRRLAPSTIKRAQ